jgi:hypothetical protein
VPFKDPEKNRAYQRRWAHARRQKDPAKFNLYHRLWRAQRHSAREQAADQALREFRAETNKRPQHYGGTWPREK